MRTLTVIGLSAILAAGAGLSPGSAVAQQKSLKEQLVGTWILVSCDQSRDGKTLLTCINGIGSINFDASGRYTAVRVVRGRPKVSAGMDSPADELKAAVQGFWGYFRNVVSERGGQDHNSAQRRRADS
jgi:hypothetical protein